MIIHQAMSLILDTQLLHLLYQRCTIALNKFKPLFEQNNSLSRLKILQEEKASLHLIQSRRISPQRLAQKSIEMLPTSLSNVINIAFAWGQLFMCCARTWRLNCFPSHLQVAIMRQPLKLVINRRLLYEICEQIMVSLDHFPDLLPIHWLFQQQPE